jgi:hypothetical protein
MKFLSNGGGGPVIEDLPNKVSAFTAAVCGFGGANHTNHKQFIDLSSVSFTSGQIHLSYTSAAGSGTLSVVSGAMVVAQIKMIGRRTEGPYWFQYFPGAIYAKILFGGRNPEALAGDVFLVKDPGHFAIDPGLSYVVATAVVGDLQDFEGQVFCLTLAREGVGPAKFPIAGEPAERRGLPASGGPEQMALRLSPLTRRSKIVSGPPFGGWHGYGWGQIGDFAKNPTISMRGE